MQHQPVATASSGIAEAPAPVSQPAPAPVAKVAATETGKLEACRLAVTGTRAALVELRKWGEAHGVSFKNLDR